MNRRLMGSVLATTVLLSLAVVPASGDDDHARKKSLKAHLSGFQEVPALSTAGRGIFRAKINRHDDEIAYELSYAGLEGNVLQSHIHLGQKSVNGGVMVFLCTNLGNGPAGTEVCPLPGGTVEGVITADGVIGPSGQGISAGEFEEVLRAIRAGAAYVNVHTSLYPGGEIRGQVR